MKEMSFISVITMAVLFLVSHFGSERGWYKRDGNWFSRLMHFFGGFFVAMFWSSFTDRFYYIFGLMMAVAIVWEICEYFYGVYKFKKTGTKDYITETRDTIEDLVCDALGVCIFILTLLIIY